MHDARLRHICSIVLVLPDGSKSFDDKDVYSWISALVFGTGGFEHIFFPLAVVEPNLVTGKSFKLYLFLDSLECKQMHLLTKKQPLWLTEET